MPVDGITRLALHSIEDKYTEDGEYKADFVIATVATLSRVIHLSNMVGTIRVLR